MQPTQPPAGGYSPDPYGQFPGCYRHPDRPTGVRCVRCDRPICGECQRPAAVGFQCPDDVAAGARSIRTPRTLVGASARPAALGTMPVVSYALIAVNVVAYVATAVSPGGSLASNQGSRLFSDWVLVPVLVGANHEYYRLVTAAFTHIGPLHLLFNMLALYMVGPALERLLGWWRFLAVYLLAALGGSVLILLFDDRGGAGASGAIFGLFACALVLSRVGGVGFDMRALLITAGLNFVITFSVPGISKMGHIGGFIVGGLATLALLGWGSSAASRRLRQVRFQLGGLAAILVVLIGVSVWRADVIGSQTSLQSGLGHTASVVHSVDGAGENYTGVITAVEDAVDNPAVSASGQP